MYSAKRVLTVIFVMLCVFAFSGAVLGDEQDNLRSTTASYTPREQEQADVFHNISALAQERNLNSR